MQVRKLALMSLVMLVLLAATSLTFAANFGAEGTGIPSDPTDDNSCYPGGQWQGLCENDYQWNAGWYHIRLMRGEITLDQVPDAYKLWMPQPAVQETVSSFLPPPVPVDTDLDGVPDSLDACPAVPGPIINGGCPVPPPVPTDTDMDGVPDSSDWCPSQPGLAINNGCPDSDSDGVIDMSDQCPAAAGSAANSGCPDSDGDGFHDGTDMCPAVPSSTNFGCPANDSDFDGIPDPMDACPFQPAPPGDADGCADEL